MSTADLAIAAMAAVSLASIGRDYRLQMKIADRFRVVSPPKTKPEPGADAAEKLPSILDRSRAGKEAS